MNRKDAEKYKKILESRQADLRRSLAEIRQTERSGQHEYTGDEGDRANVSHAKDMLLRQSTHERNLLTAIEAALARITEGTFGECVMCGDDIGPKRLEAVPWTRYCISCQDKVEQTR